MNNRDKQQTSRQDVAHPLEEGQKGHDANGGHQAQGVGESQGEPLGRVLIIAALAAPVAAAANAQRRIKAVERCQHVVHALLRVVCATDTTLELVCSGGVLRAPWYVLDNRSMCQ